MVDERTEPDSVLEFIVGTSSAKVLVDQSPIVMWDFRDNKPAQWKERSDRQEPGISADPPCLKISRLSFRSSRTWRAANELSQAEASELFRRCGLPQWARGTSIINALAKNHPGQTVSENVKSNMS